MDWYIVAGLVAAFALVLFYKPISAKISSISKAGKDGITFERPQEVGEIKPALLSFVELMREPVSASVLEREKLGQSQLQAFNLKNEEEKISVLARVLATTRIALEFNNIANTIFGSQVNLLVQLSGTHNGITQPGLRKSAEPVSSTLCRIIGSLENVRLAGVVFAVNPGNNPIARCDMMIIPTLIFKCFNHSALGIYWVLVSYTFSVLQHIGMIPMLKPLNCLNHYWFFPVLCHFALRSL